MAHEYTRISEVGSWGGRWRFDRVVVCGQVGLLVGSEGTLAVITELTLRLYGIPEATAVVRVSFEAIETAGTAISAIVAAGLAISRMDVLDEWMIRALNKFNGSELRAGPTLFIELSGSAEGIRGEP